MIIRSCEFESHFGHKSRVAPRQPGIFAYTHHPPAIATAPTAATHHRPLPPPPATGQPPGPTVIGRARPITVTARRPSPPAPQPPALGPWRGGFQPPACIRLIRCIQRITHYKTAAGAPAFGCRLVAFVTDCGTFGAITAVLSQKSTNFVDN